MPRHNLPLTKHTAIEYRGKLSACRYDKSVHEANSLANKLLKTTAKDFWKLIKTISKRDLHAPYPDSINGNKGEVAIAEMWREHYESLLNSSKLTTNKTVYNELSCTNLERFNATEVRNAAKQLKLGKSAGHDHIEAEHIRYSDDRLFSLLSLLFNCMIIHNYLPSAFMETIIVPIVKDKKESITDCNNYRPIALTTLFSKLFELVFLERYKDILITSPNQFGFKQNHGTESCLFVFKQVVDFYQSNSSPVYATFLDLSKAFDRVNHDILFNKLFRKGLHPVLLRLVHTWYRTQEFRVKWASTSSACFSVSNGVRQGSILSPSFFNVYIDDLSQMLKHRVQGCYINNVCFNHLFYADDMVLLAPSAFALQSLLDICNMFLKENDLVLNYRKSKYMVFKNDLIDDYDCPRIYIDDSALDLYFSVQYLGMWLRDDLSDNDSVLSTLKGVYCRSNLIVRNFNKCSKQVKTKLFLSYCCNFYCCSLWNNISRPCFDKFKIGHNNALRMLFNIGRRESISLHFVQLNVPNFDVLQRKAVLSLYRRLQVSTNELVMTILDMPYFVSSTLFTWWKSVIL